MTAAIRIPFTPDQLPQQRLVEVVCPPAAPEAFDPRVCLFCVPQDILPKRRPRRMTYLGMVEWAWSPMSSRIEAYFLNATRRHWVLWTRNPAPDDTDTAWQVAAYAPRRGVLAREAAHHLVVERWRAEACERFLDHFHWVADEGELTVAEWMAIGRAVWSQEGALAETAPLPTSTRGVV
jgi:hypothetical protein